MSLDAEPFKKRALACFIPPLQEQEEESAWEELKHLALIYKRNLDADRQKQPLVTAHFWIELSDGRTEDVVDPAPRRRGRPRDQAGVRLVHDLRNLLIKLGRQHGATHQDRTCYGSALEDLADVVHRMAGEPPKDGWRDKAEMASTNMGTSRRPRVLGWWFNLDHGPGAHPRSMTLEEARMWDAIHSLNFGESSSRSGTSPLGEGPEDEGDDK